MRRMTSSNTTHSIRVPFKNCNKVQIRYGQKSFTLALEWLPKQGDNPNIVINIADTANMDPPADDVTVHQIDDGDPVDRIRSLLSTTEFNTSLISANPHDDVTSTTNAYQMISGQVPMGNPYPLRNPSICPSHPLTNQRYVSGQAIVFGPGNPTSDAAFVATRTFNRSQNIEPPTPMNPSPSMSAPPMGQPTICQCPFPDHQHEHNCSVDGPKDPPMFNRQMNFPPVQRPLPPVSMLVHRDQSASNLSTQTANGGYSPAPLVRASRPMLVSQPMMPRAPSDINSAYYGQSLQSPAIPPMSAIKRSPPDDPTSRPVKLPRKRTAKAKSPRVPSPNAINHDQSLPSHLPVGGGFLATESGSYPIPMSVGKANSPVTNNATPTTPIRPSIRLVPEESSSPESVPPESAKVASPAAVSTPIDPRVRSPVSFDSSLSTEELSEMNYRGVDQIIEQVARCGETLGTPVPLPKKASASSNKKAERKPPPEGKRRPGRPPKKQQIVLDASAAMPPVTGNALDSVTHPYSASNPIVCSNNIERIAASFTDVVQIDPFLTAEHYEAVANLSAPIDSGNSILWDPDCFHHFNDPFHLATPAGPMSTFPSVDPSLGLPSIPQSATEMNLYPHPLQNDSTHAPSNGGQWQVDQVSSSVITPPGSHNSLTAGETSGLTTK